MKNQERKKMVDNLYKIKLCLEELQYDYDLAEDKSEVEHLVVPIKDLKKAIKDLELQLEGVRL